MSKRYFVALAAVFLSACPPVPNPPTPPDADAAPVIESDASVADVVTPGDEPSDEPEVDDRKRPAKDAARDVLVTTPTCAGACAALRFTGCSEGNPTPNGRTCEDVCESAKAVPNLQLPTACVSVARTIDQVRKCGVKCK